MFDLCERVRIGMNFLNSNVDKKRRYLPYFTTIFKNDPAELRHDWPDFGDLTARYVEAFILARRMLGIKKIGHVESALRKLLISYFNEDDGLSYRPKPDKPYYSTILRRMYDSHVAEGFDQARVLWALLTWYDESHDASIKQRAEELLAGLERVMVKRGDYGYYDRAAFEPDAVVDPEAEPMPHQFYFCGPQIHPLVQCYTKLNLEKALKLAQRLTNFIVYHSDYFFDDGSWNCPGGTGFGTASTDGHTHSRCATIAGIAAVGIATANKELINRARQCYDWFVENHCSSFGWSPEFLGRRGDENEGCETCTLMDQLNCAFVFAEAGFNGYYEQAERIGRNQLMENQLIDTSIIRNTVEKQDTELSCFHNVADMVRGGFAGWAGPNDFIANCGHYRLMNCCGPAGIRAMHDIWNNVYSLKGDAVYINILMDKAGDELEINNGQPWQGKLTVTIKTDCALHLIRRSWLNPKDVRVSVNDRQRSFSITADYLELGRLRHGDNIVVEYPLANTIEDVHTNGRDYKVTWLGDTVVDIAPAGRVMPFYTNRKK